MLGDCVERVAEVDEESVGLSVFSPPFPGMYVYSDSPRDMGNAHNISELIEHYSYLIPELLRVTMPGRSCCVHLCQSLSIKYLDGFSGIKDFRGAVIAAMEAGGWIYYGEVCIDKDPQVKAIRTKDQGLLFKSLANDSSRMHMALADYLLQFRKPGDNPEPIRAGISARYGNEDGWITAEEWIEWAAPVWYRASENYPGGIRETDVLNVAIARDDRDERHIAPLQLGVIERAVKLWSNPGDLVLSPFAGIGSEGYVALKHGRRFVGVELKQSYFDTAQRNLAAAEGQLSLLNGLVADASTA
jgi:DNA methylase